MEQFVLDASVGVKWIFREEMSEKAISYLRRLEQKEIQIIVPEFFYSELANICWVNFKKKLCSLAQATKALDQVMDFSLTRYSDRELSDVALENAVKFNIPVYDGIYLALSEVYVAPFITADRALFKACKARFDFIEFLGDVQV